MSVKCFTSRHSTPPLTHIYLERQQFSVIPEIWQYSIAKINNMDQFHRYATR